MEATAGVVWTYYEAVGFLKELKRVLAPVGCAVGLTGSVLLEGHSRSDLDVLLYPLSSSFDAAAVAIALSQAGLVLRADRARVTAIWRKKGSTDTKHVETWSFQGKRVDFFFLGG